MVGDGSKHTSLVSAVGGDTHIYKNVYLLKGKYPQLQVLQPPFPEGDPQEKEVAGLARCYSGSASWAACEHDKADRSHANFIS